MIKKGRYFFVKWIFIDNAEKLNVYGDYSDNFFIPPSYCSNGDRPNAVVRICADSQYVLYVNGRYAASGQYADYPFAKVYDEIDVSEYIKTGENKLDFLIYHQGVSSATYRKGEPGFCYILVYGNETVAESSEKTLGRLCPCYRSGDMEHISNEQGFAFEYDAAKESEGVPYKPVKESDMKLFFADFPIKQKDGYVPLCPRPVKKLSICEPKNAELITQGLFKINDGSLTAEKLQHASLSQRFLSEITDVKLAENKKLRMSLEYVEKGYSFVPMLDGKSSVHFTAEEHTGFDGVYAVLDLMEETAGYFYLDIDAPAGTKVYISYGEHLVDLRVRANVGGRCFTGVYTCKGGREDFTYYIRRMGLRYVQIYVTAFDFTLYRATIKPAEYPVSDVCGFHSSDSLHNKIFEVGFRTLKLCMHEHYEDCPWREQALYAMDSRNQILAGYYAFGEYDMPKASIRLLGQGMRKDGLLEHTAPSELWINIPSFSLIWIVELYEYVLYSGDIAFAAEEFPVVLQLIETFSKRADKNGMLSSFRSADQWNFYEWSKWMDDTETSSLDIEADAPITLFYILALQTAKKTAYHLSMQDTEDKDIYKAEYERLEALYDKSSKAFHDVFWDGERGAYASFIVKGKLVMFSELTNALALYAGIVPNAHKKRIAGLLCKEERIDFYGYEEKIKDIAPGCPLYLVPVTLSHTIFKYEALLKTGEEYAGYVFSNIAEKWGDMLYQGATSFWECPEGARAFDDAGSLCHGWSAIPVIIYGKYALGVYPTEPGFAKYEFKPYNTPLINAEGGVYLRGKTVRVRVSPKVEEITEIKPEDTNNMEQLKMIFHGDKVNEYPLPEGYRIEYYNGSPKQVEDWINICKDGVGLLTDDPHRDFNDFILNMNGLAPNNDLIFVVSPEGERTATIAFFIDPEDNTGLLHMVCCSEKFRGKGIGNAMTSYAIKQLLDRGAYDIKLRTDDFRIPAICSYLRFGFEPLYFCDGMEERWVKIFDTIKENKK